ncbi:MAG: ribosome small subunit-dependent GTPase A [Kocuria sp.]|nr:ribosome small subunit-dependent GTPase A [Kocuria sp.]
MARNSSAHRQWDESDVRVRANKKGSRPRTKQRPTHEDAVIARVIAVDRGRYTCVVNEQSEDQRTVVCIRAKELRRKPIVPGDQVGVVGDVRGDPDTLARIVRIEPRATILRRSADDTDPVERVIVANADRLVLVLATESPTPRTGFVDRGLAAASDAGITPVICMTKTDLKDPAEFLTYVEALDVQTVRTEPSDALGGRPAAGVHEESLAISDASIERLREILDGHISVFLGPSGVGKSTLVNALTGSERATGGVNDVTGRGRHTSSSARALRMPDTSPGTWVIDTPGIRSLGLAHVSEEELLNSFTDLVPATADCPRGCLHTQDSPGCALDEWVQRPEASPAAPLRLESLRRLLAASRGETQSGADEKQLGQAIT